MVLVQSRLATFVNDGSHVTENLLHRFRIDGKKIRYLAELAAENPETQGIIQELKRMQDVLGEWHDWVTLNATVAKLLPDTPNSPLRSAVHNILGAKYRDAAQAVSSAQVNLRRKPAVEAQASPQKRVAAAAKAVA